MRNNVSRLARLSFKFCPGHRSIFLMQRIVYGFSEFSANTVHLDEIVHPGPADALETAKLPQKLSALLRPQPGYLLQS